MYNCTQSNIISFRLLFVKVHLLWMKNILQAKLQRELQAHSQVTSN